MKLTAELVPSTSWGQNVRTMVPSAVWDQIRRKCYRISGYVCDICGGKGSNHPVECHEVWEYDDRKHVQTLTGFVSLCPMCHRVKHIGRAFVMGMGEQALRHLALVNGITVEEAGIYIENVFSVWKTRSKQSWKVDISYVDWYIT